MAEKPRLLVIDRDSSHGKSSVDFLSESFTPVTVRTISKALALLREIRAKEAVGVPAALDFVLDHPERGAMKMWVIYRVLNFRRERPELFTHGEYIPVEVAGPALGFIRWRGTEWVLVLVPLIGGEEEARGGFRVGLPKGAPMEWVDLFTGDVHHASGSGLEWPGWNRFPVALLIGR